MTITLEQIRGMNIPVGTPIEVRLKYNNEIRKDIGYFQGSTCYRSRSGSIEIQEIKLSSTVEENTKPKDVQVNDRRDIRNIEDIKVLEYKK